MMRDTSIYNISKLLCFRKLIDCDTLVHLYSKNKKKKRKRKNACAYDSQSWQLSTTELRNISALSMCFLCKVF